MITSHKAGNFARTLHVFGAAHNTPRSVRRSASGLRGCAGEHRAADRAVGQDAEGADGGILINLSVWESVEALGAYVYGEAHLAVLRRRRQWFERMTQAYTALWWIPRGHIPTVHEAEERVTHLRAHGPTPSAFTLRVHFPPPDSGDAEMLLSPEDWTCPA